MASSSAAPSDGGLGGDAPTVPHEHIGPVEDVVEWVGVAWARLGGCVVMGAWDGRGGAGGDVVGMGLVGWGGVGWCRGGVYGGECGVVCVCVCMCACVCVCGSVCVCASSRLYIDYR